MVDTQKQSEIDYSDPGSVKDIRARFKQTDYTRDIACPKKFVLNGKPAPAAKPIFNKNKIGGANGFNGVRIQHYLDVKSSSGSLISPGGKESPSNNYNSSNINNFRNSSNRNSSGQSSGAASIISAASGPSHSSASVAGSASIQSPSRTSRVNSTSGNSTGATSNSEASLVALPSKSSIGGSIITTTITSKSSEVVKRNVNVGQEQNNTSLNLSFNNNSLGSGSKYTSPNSDRMRQVSGSSQNASSVR